MYCCVLHQQCFLTENIMIYSVWRAVKSWYYLISSYRAQYFALESYWIFWGHTPTYFLVTTAYWENQDRMTFPSISQMSSFTIQSKLGEILKFWEIMRIKYVFFLSHKQIIINILLICLLKKVYAHILTKKPNTPFTITITTSITILL